MDGIEDHIIIMGNLIFYKIKFLAKVLLVYPWILLLSRNSTFWSGKNF